MKLRLMARTAILLTLAGGAIFAQAAQRGKGLKALNLTAAQKQQAKVVREQTKQSMQPLRPQLQASREALNAAIKAGNAAQIRALSQQHAEIRGKAAALRNEGIAQIYSTLTSEQRDKIEARRQARKNARKVL